LTRGRVDGLAQKAAVVVVVDENADPHVLHANWLRLGPVCNCRFAKTHPI
jgi:hypothetical protein